MRLSLGQYEYLPDDYDILAVALLSKDAVVFMPFQEGTSVAVRIEDFHRDGFTKLSWLEAVMGLKDTAND